MALQYCSRHQRLFAVRQKQWIAFPSELITRIKELYQRFPLPEFEIIETRCDQCDDIAPETSREPLDTPRRCQPLEGAAQSDTSRAHCRPLPQPTERFVARRELLNNDEPECHPC